ncbi:ISAzo13 family transposase [Desulfococcaceae bacterium HSG7]|nr:ISAzo13 family transposase [Desulfococcaceae bacterium HSG7]
MDEKYLNIHEVFLEIIEEHTAGCPMNDDIRWTYFTHQEIVDKSAEKEIDVSPPTVADLLKSHGFKKRKMSQCKTIKDVENRDKQFINIDRLRYKFTQEGEPVVSIDSKKKEPFGSLYREGEVYSTTAPEVYDHSFASLLTGLSVPHGIYDITANKACIDIGLSRDTTEFFYDSMVLWWETYGKVEYPDATKPLILCDGGGSDGCRHYVFKEAVRKLADKPGIIVRIAHYPAYCSKYNPIEHRVFPHVTRALSGVVLDSVQTMKELIENRAKTKKGLETCVNVVDKIYETGKKASELFMKNMPIVFDQFLPKWNYKAMPVS